MQIALREFLVQVSSIERTLEIRDRLIAVGQDSPRHLNPSSTVLRRTVRRIGLSGMQPGLDGSVLLLAAAFEQFVADVMIAFTSYLPQKVPTYANLPNAIRSANERLTGEAISTLRSRFTEFERKRFVDNLSNCQSRVVPYVLNGEAIALNSRNLTSGTFRELISRLGVQDIWSEIGKTRSLKAWSGLGGSKAARSRAEALLNELISNRNQISHRTGGTTLGPDVIRSYIQFERVLASSLVKGLEEYAKSL